MKFSARFPLMVVSFVISLTLWLYVQKEEDPNVGVNSSFALPIEYQGLPEDYVPISRPTVYTFYPIGSDEERRKINFTELHAIVDLSRPTIGASDYTLVLKTDRTYNVTWNPATAKISVILDKKVDGVSKPIQVRYSGQLRDPAFEYVPDQTTISPPVVYVSGPKTVVDRVDHAEAVLDLSEVRPGERNSYESPIQLISRDGVIVSDQALKFNVGPYSIMPGLRLASETRPFVVNPIFKGSVAFGFQVKRAEAVPSQIDLTGRSEKLNEIGRLETEPVDLTGITQTTTIRAKVIVPTSVEKAEPKFVDVKIVVEPSPRRQPSGG